MDMITLPADRSTLSMEPGTDCRPAFRAAYENRYTWDKSFPGYRGQWQMTSASGSGRGRFEVGSNCQVQVEGLADKDLEKAVHSQLWEVAIHRVRRSFDQVHGENGFVAGDTNATGMEVIVTGKAAGDRYRIQGNVVTMVYRHIHGQVVTIHTEAISQTGEGYLSRRYRSRYSDPSSGESLGLEKHFWDTFTPLSTGHWTLAERIIRWGGREQQVFRFLELESL